MDISSFQQKNTAQIIYIDIYVNWKLRLCCNIIYKWCNSFAKYFQ